MSDLLYSVNEIFGDNVDGYLKIEKKEYYSIPVYQRGYKWKPAQVKKLLEDVHNFQPEGNKFYCLQNITVVPSKTALSFNVVDGQQRLTTLIIVLAYLGKKDMVKNKVRFPDQSIREQTNKFLLNLTTNNSYQIENTSWVQFIKTNSEFDHQDIFYLFTAYQATHAWFTTKQIDKESFLMKLLNNVRLIVNSISDDNREEKIFGNLNSKKVPLDGADLVRAILITRVAYEEGKREADIKNIVRVNERRVRIGWELDEINNWWSKKDVRNYFKRFNSIKSDELSEQVRLFRDDKYPINLLLLLFAEKNGKDKLTLEFIEEKNNNALELYKELVKLHSTLKDWFTDREIYHYLGFLFVHSNLKFKELWDYWFLKTETREQFKQFLKGKMKDALLKADTSTLIQTDGTNWYEDEQQSLIKILVGLDVIWSTRNNQAFLPPSAFDKISQDIEHIFPQNPKEIKDKKAFIEFLVKCKLAKKNKTLEAGFANETDNPDFIKKVNDYISKYTGQIKTNSIGNLVLLDASKNRSIGNNPYSVKRAALVEDINRGVFMRPHTLKVFVRYFDAGKVENRDAVYWTNSDIDANAKAIAKTLEGFFTN